MQNTYKPKTHHAYAWIKALKKLKYKKEHTFFSFCTSATFGFLVGPAFLPALDLGITTKSSSSVDESGTLERQRDILCKKKQQKSSKNYNK
jgi:hypothetical protein